MSPTCTVFVFPAEVGFMCARGVAQLEPARWGLFAARVSPVDEHVIIRVHTPVPTPTPPSLLSYISGNKCTLGFLGPENISLGIQDCFSWW